MKNAALLCLTGALAFGASANTPDSSSNPYQGIVDRNIFGLRPPPPPASNEPAKPPPPAVTLTGITTILGKKLAFMNVQIPPKPGEQAKQGPQSMMLGVGEREGEIEVLDIDEKGGIVKLNDYGVITNVPFAKLPNTPSAPVNTAAAPSPNPAHLGGNPVVPQRSIPGLPTRTLRTGNPAVQNPGAPATGASTTGAGNPGFSGIPTQNGVPNGQAEPPMTPEEQVILMEAQREQFKAKGDPSAGLLPPTEITSPEDLKGMMNAGSRLPRGFNQGNPQLPQ